MEIQRTAVTRNDKERFKTRPRLMMIAGARPNFVKVAALIQACREMKVPVCLVHTGQHYDKDLSDIFFDQLEIPRPDHSLGVGSGSRADQTARIMLGFEPVLMAEEPEAVVVVGDVNSTLACSLVTAKAVFPGRKRPFLVHVEAGLRSRDRTMPEETNRLVTDHVSDLLLVSEPSGRENLLREGLDPAKVVQVGNVMIDTLRRLEGRARRTEALAQLGLEGKRFGLATLHRPSNVDSPDSLNPLIIALEEIGQEMPLLLAAHPRTGKAMENQGLSLSAPGPRWAEEGGLALSGPLPYLDFLGLMARATIVLTDSGGIQEETTALGVPCLTLRPNTERPVTIDQGTNRLVTRAEDILPAFRRAMESRTKDNRAEENKVRVPEMWDGKAALRAIKAILDALPGPA